MDIIADALGGAIPETGAGTTSRTRPLPFTILRDARSRRVAGSDSPAAHSEFGQGAMNRTRHPFCDFSSGKGVSVWGVGV